MWLSTAYLNSLSSDDIVKPPAHHNQRGGMWDDKQTTRGRGSTMIAGRLLRHPNQMTMPNVKQPEDPCKTYMHTYTSLRMPVDCPVNPRIRGMSCPTSNQKTAIFYVHLGMTLTGPQSEEYCVFEYGVWRIRICQTINQRTTDYSSIQYNIRIHYA